MLDTGRRSLELWSQRSIDAYLDLFHEDVEYIGPGRIIKGHDAFRQHMRMYDEAFPNERLTFIRGAEADSTVFLQFRIQGTHLGTMRWSNSRQIEPTGREYDLECVTVQHFNEDKIIRIVDFFDLYEMIFRQLKWPFPSRQDASQKNA